jgi:hypothetical protein
MPDDPTAPPPRPLRIVARTPTPGTPPVIAVDPAGPGLTLRRRIYTRPQPRPHDARVDRKTDDPAR